MSMFPEIDFELCDGCGNCAVACSGGGITIEQGKIVIIETATCEYCGVCEAVCPQGAIKCFYIIVPAEDE